MSGLDGQGHPEPITAECAANTLKYIADDHPCCAHALEEITIWLESLCPQCNAPRMYYDGWNCPNERCDGETCTARGPENIWLQWNGDGQPDGSPVSVGDVTWSTEQVFEHDERYTKATAWMPIATAPQTGGMLVCCNRTPSCDHYKSDIYHAWRDQERASGWARWPHDFPPTHWHPLPNPPTV